MSDSFILLKDTAKLYFKLLSESALLTLYSWKVVLYQCVLLFVLGVITLLLGSLGFLGSLILGLILVLALSVYYSMISSIVRKDTITLESAFREGLVLFHPFLSIFFSLFLLSLIMGRLGSGFLQVSVSIILTVLLNPLPEVTYFEGGGLRDIVFSAYEFMLNNFLEWVIPFVIIMGMVFSFSPEGMINAFSQMPLTRVELLLLRLAQHMLNPFQAISIIPILFILTFINVFRGKLFIALQKGRRARMYELRSK